MNSLAINTFIEYLRQSGKSSSTVIAYTKDLKDFNEYFSGKRLEKLTQEEIDKYKEFLLKQLLTEKTVSRKLNSISSFYKYLKENNIISENPVKKIEYPRPARRKQRVINMDEYRAILEAAKKDKRLYVALQTLFQTGIRISEIVNLTVADAIIETDVPHLKIKQNNTNPSRIVPLNDKILYILKDYLSSHPFINIAQFPMFYTTTNKAIHVRNLRASLTRIFAKAKIKDLSVNDIRTTFIVHQLKAGNSVDFVGKIVGHRSKAATERYLRLCGGYKCKNLEKVVEF
ncbi:MAG: tyrosine recombinase [Candidatus Dojkabacteria bacterium]